MNSTVTERIMSIGEEKKDVSQILRFVFAALIGFSLSQLDAMGDFSPFSVAFAAGLPFDYCFCAFFGSAVGYFVARPWDKALRYVFALMISALFRLIVKRRFDTADKPFVCAVVSFCAVLCSGAAYLAFASFTLSAAAVVMCEALCSFLSVLLFLRAVKIPVMSIGIRKLSSQDAACLCVNICVLLMCASGFTLGSVSPARIIAALAVIFAAQHKGISASSVVGICAGAALCIREDLHFMFPLFAFGGLAAGIFSPLGQYTTALSFALAASAVTIVCGLDELRLFPLAEAIIACAAYAVIPSRWINSVQEHLEQSGLTKDDQVQRQVCANLENAAQKVSEVSTIVTRVSEKLDKIINPEIDRIFAKMQQNVCYGCGKKGECWNKFFNETAMDIMIIAGIQSGSGGRTKLEQRCLRPNALKAEIDKYYADFVTSMASKMKVSEMRSIVSDQFSAVAQFLSEIADQTRNSRVADSSKSRAVKTALGDGGIFVSRLNYYTNTESCVTVEAVLNDESEEIDLNKMKNIIEFITGKKFERPEIAITEINKTVIFEQKASYKILSGSSQIPYSKNRVSGDCIGSAYDMNGSEIVLISDGMGTGSRAAVDATMTTALMEKLLSCGFSFENALKMVNCALMVKSTDESLSTVDGVCINIYTADADFYKAGAAVSFIRSGRNVTVVEEASMPVGIIRNIVPAHRRVRLSDGDIILLVSDGVTVGDCGWISDELLAWSTNSMDDLAAHIASLAKLRSDEKSADDISVAAVKIVKNK